LVSGQLKNSINKSQHWQDTLIKEKYLKKVYLPEIKRKFYSGINFF
jgi:hypothetical protein